MEIYISDPTQVGLTSNFFVLCTNMKVLNRIIHSWWSLARIFMEERVKFTIIELVFSIRYKFACAYSEDSNQSVCHTV